MAISVAFLTATSLIAIVPLSEFRTPTLMPVPAVRGDRGGNRWRRRGRGGWQPGRRGRRCRRAARGEQTGRRTRQHQAG